MYAEYNVGVHNVLLYANYISAYEDERYSVDVDSQSTIDLHYQLSILNDAARVTLSGINLSDEQPPAARVDLGYDAYTHQGFGRMFKVGIEYTLQ